jgi:hypothetical protein
MSLSWTQRIILYRKFLQENLDRGSLDAIDALIRGEIPYHFLQGLPHADKPGQEEEHVRAIALGVLGLMYLRPVCYRSEYDGKVVQDITPRPGKEEEASSSGMAPLPLHTDMAFLRFPGESLHPILAAAPDFLVLAGIVNIYHIKTRIVPLPQVLERLEVRDIRELSRPSFDIASPDSVNPRRVSESVPLLFQHADYGTMIRYNNADDKVVAKEDAGAQALSRLDAVLRSPELGEEFDVQPGSLLVFNNRQVVHGRAAIAPAEESRQPPADRPENPRRLVRLYGQRIETETNPVFPTDPFLQAV